MTIGRSRGHGMHIQTIELGYGTIARTFLFDVKVRQGNKYNYQERTRNRLLWST